MDDWHYGSWLQEMYMTGKLTIPAIIFGVLALVGAIIYFVDGIRKYGYWFQKDDKEEGK